MFHVCVACFLHAGVECVACGIEILDVLDIRFEWLRLYESLLTYVAHLDLVGDPLQDTCRTHVPKIHY